MSRKKGLVGKLGRGMQKTGRAGRKGTGKVRKGMKSGSKFVNRQLGKSKAGRGLRKGMKMYKKARKNTLNKAFKRCKAEFCNDAKDVVDAGLPG